MAQIYLDAIKNAAIEPLQGGITNKNFLVYVGAKPRYVLREFGKNTQQLGIDRRREARNSALASSIGIAPKIIFFDLKKGRALGEFIKGRRFEEESKSKNRKEAIKAIIKTLKKLHGSGLQFFGRADLFGIIRDYRKTAIKSGAILSSRMAKAIDFAKKLEKILKKNPKPLTPEFVPSHLDLMGGNIILGEAKKSENKNTADFYEAKLIDWEYSAKASPFFDLSLLSVLNDFSEEDEEIIFQHYFMENNFWGGTEEIAKDKTRRLYFTAYKAGAAVREALWGAIQTKISDLDFDFREYEEKQLARFEKFADDFLKSSCFKI